MRTQKSEYWLLVTYSLLFYSFFSLSLSRLPWNCLSHILHSFGTHNFTDNPNSPKQSFCSNTMRVLTRSVMAARVKSGTAYVEAWTIFIPTEFRMCSMNVLIRVSNANGHPYMHAQNRSCGMNFYTIKITERNSLNRDAIYLLSKYDVVGWKLKAISQNHNSREPTQWSNKSNTKLHSTEEGSINNDSFWLSIQSHFAIDLADA